LIGIFGADNQPLFGLRNLVTVSILPGIMVAAYVATRLIGDPLFESDRKWIEAELRRLVS
jgi:hypothetical protein